MGYRRYQDEMVLQSEMLTLESFAALHLHINVTGEMVQATSLAMILGLSSSDPASKRGIW